MADSQPFSIQIRPATPPVTDSALLLAAAALAPGESANFVAQPWGSTYDGLAWQISCYYDSVRRRIHLLGKRANDNADWRHAYYDEMANDGAGAWVDGGLNGASVNLSGHIYGCSTFDELTGDLYLQTWSNAYVRRWTALTQAWDFVTATHAWNPSSPPINGIVWHPDLYGVGDGGLLWPGNNATDVYSIRAWRKSTNTWESLGSLPRNNTGHKHGGGAYFRAINKGIVGCCEVIDPEEINAVGLVTPNVTPGLSPTIAEGGIPPASVATGQLDGRLPMGALVQHPGDPDKMMLLQRYSVAPPHGGNQTWLTEDAVNWTAGPAHPWTLNVSRVVCSLPADGQGNYGVIWMIGPTASILWKPTI